LPSPDVTAEASPSTFLFSVVVAVHTPPAQVICSAVGAVPVVEAEGAEDSDDVFAVVDVDPAHPVRRAAVAIRTIGFLMAFSRFAPVVGFGARRDQRFACFDHTTTRRREEAAARSDGRARGRSPGRSPRCPQQDVSVGVGQQRS